MKRLAVVLVVVGLNAAVQGCNTMLRQPAILNADITPSELGPGDTAIISVEIQDGSDIVERVEGVVEEDPSIVFKLKDDGVDPDEEEGDGIWTLKVDVPFNAPPGDFEFTLTAYNSKGQAITILDEAGEVSRLSARFGLVIRYPQKQ